MVGRLATNANEVADGYVWRYIYAFTSIRRRRRQSYPPYVKWKPMRRHRFSLQCGQKLNDDCLIILGTRAHARYFGKAVFVVELNTASDWVRVCRLPRDASREASKSFGVCLSLVLWRHATPQCRVDWRAAPERINIYIVNVERMGFPRFIIASG